LALNKTSCAAHRAILSNFLDVDRLGVREADEVVFDDVLQ